MKYQYSPDADVLVMRLRKGKLDYGEQNGNVISHFSKERKLLELEILDASEEVALMIKSIMKPKRQ